MPPPPYFDEYRLGPAGDCALADEVASRPRIIPPQRAAIEIRMVEFPHSNGTL
jgi:hypothetical protein